MKNFFVVSVYKITLTTVLALLLAALLIIPASAETCRPDGQLINDATGEIIGTCDPSAAAPYRFEGGGIFGCNQTGSYAMSVGSLSAVGGVYVPTNDAAVTLNSGFITYKECILDGVNKRFAESASTDNTRFGINAFLTGRDGTPFFSVDFIADMLARSDETFLRVLQVGELSPLNTALRGDVMRALARNYQFDTRAANRALQCPYQGDLNSVLTGQTNDVWGGLMALTNPACNPLGAFHLAKEYTQSNIARNREEMLFRLTTGQGTYGVEEVDPVTGARRTLTPGSIVSGNIQQLITSGFRQLENADEIDQMVGALFSGLSAHSISDSRGLSGLTQPTLGQPSYLEQMAREASQGLRDSAINAALQILSAGRQVETTYLNAMNAIASNLTQTIGQLRSAENSCWALVVPAAQTYANQNGFQITAATSTAFSQQVIDSQIAAPASVTVANVEKSEQALQLINRLIAGVTNTSSLEAQRLALQQLDSLVAQGLLHNQYDAGQATQRKGEVEEAMTTLVEDTIKAWADSTDLNVGWRNLNNADVAKMWAERWRR